MHCETLKAMNLSYIKNYIVPTIPNTTTLCIITAKPNTFP